MTTIADEWTIAIGRFRASLVEHGRSRETARVRSVHLVRFARSVDVGPWDVTEAEIKAYVGRPDWAASTRRTARSALSTFYRWAELAEGARYPACLDHGARIPKPAAPEKDPRWQEAIKDWTDWMRAGGVSVAALQLREYQLRRFAAAMAGRDPWLVSQDEIAGWLAGHGWSLETLRSYRSAIRSFYAWATDNGLILADPARGLRKVAPGKGRPRPAPEAVVAKALRLADDRVHLMLSLGAFGGLRRAEIAQVNTKDLIEGADGWSLMVHGKGGKDREVPLLDEIAEAIRDSRPGWIFPNVQGGHLTPAHVGVLMRRALGSGVTAHQLRHRFASVSYQATKDIRAVQELLGHTSVATTQRYTAVADNALRNAVRAAGPMRRSA